MTDLYQNAHFLHSAFELSQLVPDEGVEIAFAGRSNSGKSTAINRLTRQKRLCKTSKTPGRTQLINFFALSHQLRLVDLPGYGFAKVPKKMRGHWNLVLYRYLNERQSLKGLIVLIDIRRGISDLDRGLFDIVDENLPMHILLTKSDKLKKGARSKALLIARQQVQNEGITVSCFSAITNDGIEEFKRCCNRFLGLNPALDSPNPHFSQE